MNAFFSLDVLDEATRRAPFVQQISSWPAGTLAKVQTMPAEPLHRPERDTASAPAAARRRPGARVTRSAPW
jgi:hypothetical protein